MTNVEIISDSVGSGVEASKGALVFIEFTGHLDNGVEFDSTKRHGRPFEFVVGSKKVIAGLSLGVLGMREGGVRRFRVPSELAYQNRQIGAFITPGSALNYEVKLLEARPRE